jgi:lysyl-tRNA synthetase class II
MMFGIIRKKDLEKLTVEYERKFAKLMNACDTTIKQVKDKCMGSDKMYARSNEIKFKSMDMRISLLEQILEDKLKQFHAENKDKEIRAADEAHAKIEL